MSRQPVATHGRPAVGRRPWSLPRGVGWDVVGVVALGGAMGAVARYSVGQLWPTRPGDFPWATFATNVVGCALIGILMVLVTEVWPVGRLVRPFAATGVLGGFTTFSTYAVDITRLVDVGAARTGLICLMATPVAAVSAVSTTTVLTRWAARTLKG